MSDRVELRLIRRLFSKDDVGDDRFPDSVEWVWQKYVASQRIWVDTAIPVSREDRENWKETL